jgi:uncharacterized LabA/DUF88 family protein
MNSRGKRLWLIDGGYFFNACRSVARDYQFDYLKLRTKLEEDGSIWRAYYLNSVPNASMDAVSNDGFHNWLQAAPPRGPKIIVKLYQLKDVPADSAYCEECGRKVHLVCPNAERETPREHRILNKQQKGVDVGIATLALIHRANYDTLMLSSGDGDFIDMIEYLSESGKRIELVVFNEAVSTDIQARADHIYWINDFADEIRRTK